MMRSCRLKRILGKKTDNLDDRIKTGAQAVGFMTIALPCGFSTFPPVMQSISYLHQKETNTIIIPRASYSLKLFWSQRQESNLRPTDYKSVALPTELRWRISITTLIIYHFKHTLSSTKFNISVLRSNKVSLSLSLALHEAFFSRWQVLRRLFDYPKDQALHEKSMHHTLDFVD